MAASGQAAARVAAEAEAPSLEIRPARKEDADDVAWLYVQLWETELPMLMVGGREPTQEFLRRQMLAEDGRRLRDNFVGVVDGEVVAVYGVSTKDNPRPSFWRPGVIGDMVDCAGLLSLLRLVWPIVRNLAVTAADEWPGTLYMSNLVIKKGYRRYGFGERFFRHFVETAVERGYDRIAGQVMDANAIAFYHHMNYLPGLDIQEDGPVPRGWLARKIGRIESVIMWSPVPRKKDR
jgi:ribosomal protein S18 acetylase RimI-like enzyme